MRPNFAVQLKISFDNEADFYTQNKRPNSEAEFGILFDNEVKSICICNGYNPK